MKRRRERDPCDRRAEDQVRPASSNQAPGVVIIIHSAPGPSPVTMDARPARTIEHEPTEKDDSDR